MHYSANRAIKIEVPYIPVDAEDMQVDIFRLYFRRTLESLNLSSAVYECYFHKFTLQSVTNVAQTATPTFTVTVLCCS